MSYYKEWTEIYPKIKPIDIILNSEGVTETPRSLALGRDIVYYGPHKCQRCNAMICRSGNDMPGIEFDYPEGPIYPNTPWVLHVCGL